MTTQRCPSFSSWAAFTATAMTLPELPPVERTVRPARAFAHTSTYKHTCVYNTRICANTLERSVGAIQACVRIPSPLHLAHVHTCSGMTHTRSGRICRNLWPGRKPLLWIIFLLEVDEVCVYLTIKPSLRNWGHPGANEPSCSARTGAKGRLLQAKSQPRTCVSLSTHAK